MMAAAERFRGMGWMVSILPVTDEVDGLELTFVPRESE